MKVTIETISPQDAEQLLKSNVNNRKVRKTRVALYAKQIENGQWQSTGEAIKISKTGRLLDGQHRLHAVVQAGKPVQFLVIRDLEDDVFKVLDSGLTRGASDVVRALGVVSATDVGAVVRAYLVVSANLNPANTNAMSLITRTDIADYVSDHQQLVSETVCVARNTKNAVGGSTTGWGVLRLVIADEFSLTEADEFIDSVVSGAGFTAGDPRLALRNWLSRNTKVVSSGNPSAIHIGTYLKAFIAFKRGEKVQLLRSWDTTKTPPSLVGLNHNKSVQVYP